MTVFGGVLCICVQIDYFGLGGTAGWAVVPGTRVREHPGN
jgi:hypothetical protein